MVPPVKGHSFRPAAVPALPSTLSSSCEWTKNLINDFSGLGLSAKVTDAVAAAGYTKPTDIQAPGNSVCP